MKRQLFFCFAILTFFVYSVASNAAQYSLNLDGGYLYTRWEYQSPTSTFSLLSKAGTTARAEFTVGNARWDLVLGGALNQFTFTTPTTRVLDEEKINTLGLIGGVRLKTPYIWTTLSYQSKQGLYLVENSTTDFSLKKETQGFTVLNLTLFGWGAGYKITLEGEIGVPTGAASTDDGEMKYSYFTQGTARVEFGSNWRVGLFVGIENQEYSVADDDKYYRSDFFGGLTFAFGAGKSGGRSGSSGRIPNWPL